MEPRAKADRKGETPRAFRKPYRTPQLVEYGSVAKLTQTGGTTKSEPHGFKMPCL